MMLGEGNPSNPTVHVPPWAIFDDPTAGMLCPSPHPVSGVSVNNSNGGGGVGFEDYSLFLQTVAALHRYLPSNDTDPDELGSDSPGREVDSVMDVYSCDEFRMYEFKVRRCARGRSHDWTECPFAHPGEKARRRDPRKFHYSGTACPDFRKGNCKRGDACEYAHGVFECWLHPARYRTQPCKDGINCRRRVCFFAHTPEQLRVLPNQSQSQVQSPKSAAGACSVVFDSYDGSPLRSSAYFSPPKSAMLTSPTSTLLSPPLSPPSDSPPHSPIGSGLRRSVPSSSVNEVLASLRQLQLNKAKSIPPSWGVQFGSPKMAGVRSAPPLFRSLPSTPTTTSNAGARWLDVWEGDCVEEEPMERVESGRDLRAKIFEKLSKENLMEKDETEGAPLAATAPDVDWVSELVM